MRVEIGAYIVCSILFQPIYGLRYAVLGWERYQHVHMVRIRIDLIYFDVRSGFAFSERCYKRILDIRCDAFSSVFGYQYQMVSSPCFLVSIATDQIVDFHINGF